MISSTYVHRKKLAKKGGKDIFLYERKEVKKSYQTILNRGDLTIKKIENTIVIQ